MNGIKYGALCLMLLYVSANCVMTRAEKESANILEKKVNLIAGLKHPGWEIEAKQLIQRLEQEYVPKGYEMQKLHALKEKLRIPQPHVFEQKQEKEQAQKPVEEKKELEGKPFVKLTLAELDKEIVTMLQIPSEKRDAVWYGTIAQYIYEVSLFDKKKEIEYLKRVYPGFVVAVCARPERVEYEPISEESEGPTVVILSLGKKRKIEGVIFKHQREWKKFFEDKYTIVKATTLNDFEYPVVKAIYKRGSKDYDWRVEGQENRDVKTDMQFPEALPESFIKQIMEKPQVIILGDNFILELDEASKNIVGGGS